MIFIVFLLVLIVAGILMYALCTNGKLAEIGRIMFGIGLFFLVYTLSTGHGISLPR
jgi:Na+/phosphate symporter